MNLQLLIIIILSAHQCNGVIYHLNESEYDRMPPVFHLSPYEACVGGGGGGGGRYCHVEFQLVADAHSELLNMIHEYSSHKPIHFNHTELQYGICVTQLCKDFELHTAPVSKAILEACLNETMWKDYELRTKVTEMTCNEGDSDKIEMNTVDLLVAVICLGLLMLNVIGSFQEFVVEKGRQGRFLSCFSVTRNLKLLVAPADVSDPRLVGLQGLYGMRTITMVMVLCCHSLAPFVMISSNTRAWEDITYDLLKYLANGTLVVQTFFILSGFLQAYNLQLSREKTTITSAMVPKILLLRWLRLVSPCALMLAITATWLRFTRSGPLWQLSFGASVEDCRRDWWLVLLFVGNYVDGSNCMPETWYLATDMQLTVLGLSVCVLLQGRARGAVLMLLVGAGMVATAAHTYFQDLDAKLIIYPEGSRRLIVHDPTFNHVYKRGHTNTSSYFIGMLIGLLVYHWQKTGIDLKQYPKLRYIYWLLFPVSLTLVFCGSIFYSDAPRADIYFRVLWATLTKPVFCILMGLIIVGLAFQIEDLYRGILSWRVWVCPARLCYSAYIIHVFIIRCFIALRTTLLHVSYVNIVIAFISITLTTFLMAVPFWLLVEAPCTNVAKLLVSKTQADKELAAEDNAKKTL